MKVSRQKHVRKVLNFYKHNFGYQPPFIVLIDGTFCKSALKFQVNISEQLPKYLQAETKLCTTACVKAECEALGTLLYGPLKILNQYEVKPCGHPSPISASNCIRKMALKQRHKFIIATQDSELNEQVRDIAGTPILYLSHNSVNLETPSETSKEEAAKKEQERLAPADHQQLALKKLKREAFGEEEEKKKRKAKKIKGANPLSCKKKKKRPGEKVVKKNPMKKTRKRKKMKVDSETLAQMQVKKMIAESKTS